MKHYFYFKKGQAVPQWLLSIVDRITNKPISRAVFGMKGKAMVDDSCGDVILWPANKRDKQLFITIRGNDWSMGDTVGRMIMYRWVKGKRTTSPLVAARGHSLNIRSTTKCQPIPETFQR